MRARLRAAAALLLGWVLAVVAAGFLTSVVVGLVGEVAAPGAAGAPPRVPGVSGPGPAAPSDAGPDESAGPSATPTSEDSAEPPGDAGEPPRDTGPGAAGGAEPAPGSGGAAGRPPDPGTPSPAMPTPPSTSGPGAAPGPAGPTSAPTAGPAARPAPGPTPSGAANPDPPTERRSFVTPGGTVVVACRGGRTTIASVTPRDGWRYDVRPAGGSSAVTVAFSARGAGDVVHVDVACRGGRPVRTGGGTTPGPPAGVVLPSPAGVVLPSTAARG
ncbi:hypothetical protein KC207_13615 [Phycicoccus sp. BSK3Z-2]|uniref:Uncharacterized protein n=1 Tax=Phycicoccus avicenniae TaxID=2828860 RepID=A0A941DDH3_9MICO|nr:hypothetical protein [Phycicoccus avicenniae]MBR7744327.1 hypothetical protein [Phycicoccus avicenniae]